MQLGEKTRMYARVSVRPFSILAAQAWHYAIVSASATTQTCLWAPAGPLSHGIESGSTPSVFSSCPTVVDEVSSLQNGAWEPWTRPPVCTKPRHRDQQPYCVYTHSSLAGSGSGISILTTPDFAAATAQVVDGIDPVWGMPSSSGKLPRVSGRSRFLDDEMQGPRVPPPYEVRSIPGKGKGVVANASIAPGELLFRERPVLVDMMVRPAYVSVQQHRKLLDRALARLPPADRDRVRALSYHDATHVPTGIMAANTFGITFNGIPHSGLYPEISRINHACRPNSLVRYRRSTLELEVVAYQPIEPGTELSVSYTPLNLLSKERRRVLRGWGFDCSCAACSAPRPEIEASDLNRQRVQDILDELDDAWLRVALANGEDDGLVGELLSEMDALIHKEGITAQAGDIDAIAAELFLEADDLAGSRKFAQRAVRRLRTFAGEDSERTEQAESFLDRLDKADSLVGRLDKKASL